MWVEIEEKFGRTDPGTILGSPGPGLHLASGRHVVGPRLGRVRDRDLGVGLGPGPGVGLGLRSGPGVGYVRDWDGVVHVGCPVCDPVHGKSQDSSHSIAVHIL